MSILLLRFICNAARKTEKWGFMDNKLKFMKLIVTSSLADQSNKMAFSKSDLKVSCSKGCGECCFQPIRVTQTEGEFITSYVNHFNVEYNLPQLKAQYGKSNNEFLKLRSNDRKCIFLGDDMCCKVYDVRPLVCRNYFVISPKNICNRDSDAKIKVTGSQTAAELIANFLSEEKISGLLANMVNLAQSP